MPVVCCMLCLPGKNKGDTESYTFPKLEGSPKERWTLLPGGVHQCGRRQRIKIGVT